jgi:hypothetical protein
MEKGQLLRHPRTTLRGWDLLRQCEAYVPAQAGGVTDLIAGRLVVVIDIASGMVIGDLRAPGDVLPENRWAFGASDEEVVLDTMRAPPRRRSSGRPGSAVPGQHGADGRETR